jgi:methylmalonyl-CoA mutase C-terminal domain/subunit
MKIFAGFMRDAGLEVIYLGPRQTVETMVNAAIQEDADFIGYSIYSGIYLEVAQDTVDLLKQKGADDIRIVMGGIIPKQDIPALEEIGVAKAFVSGEPLASIAAYLNGVETK